MGVAHWLYESLPLRQKCVAAALREQGLQSLVDKLALIADDEKIKHQYTSVGYDTLNHPYWVTKIRGQHAFQMLLVLNAVEKLGLTGKPLTVVDIGDSAGTHISYLQKLLPEVRGLSVNLDPQAVAKIKERGLDAVCCRAEELDKYNIAADLLLSFETVEHLTDPIGFFHDLAIRAAAPYAVVTVPYCRASRVSLNYIRCQDRRPQPAEDVHVFELSPEDWKLLFRFSGWETVADRIYYQYPRRDLYRLTKTAWRNSDYEGFFGVVLRKDATWAELYKDWG